MTKKKKVTKQQTIAYLRVSKDLQDLEKNKKDILLYAHKNKLGKVKFIAEKVSSRTSWKDRKIGKLITEDLNKGDIIIVSEISRLGRSILEIMEIIILCLDKGIHIHGIKNGWKLENSIQSKIMAFAFSIAAEVERDLISSRTKEALAAKKAAGVKLGRPPGPGRSKLDPHKEEIQALLANGATQRHIAKKYAITPVQLCKYVKTNKLKPV